MIVLMLAALAMANQVVLGGSGVIEVDDTVALTINTTNPLTQPVLLNGVNVVESITLHRSTLEAQQSMLEQQGRSVQSCAHCHEGVG